MYVYIYIYIYICILGLDRAGAFYYGLAIRVHCRRRCRREPIGAVVA